MKTNKTNTRKKRVPNREYKNKTEALKDIKEQIRDTGKKPTADRVIRVAGFWYRDGRISYNILSEIEEDPDGIQRNLLVG